jgi:hypothetical protein
VNSSEMETRDSKTLGPSEPARQPSWLVWTLMKSFRLLFLTVMWTGLGMGLGLFTGIMVLMTAGAFQHRMLPMDAAYRQIAIPFALCTGGCAFLWNLIRTLQAAARRRREQ